MEYNHPVLTPIWPRRILEVLLFVGVFVLVSQGASYVWGSFGSLFGMFPIEAERILLDNEALLQLLALAAAAVSLVVYRRRAQANGAWLTLRRQLWTPIPRGRRDEACSVALSYSLRAFLAVSVVVGVSSFLGFAQLETGWGESFGTLIQVVSALPEVALLALWIFAIDGARSLLWHGLVGQDTQGGSFQNRLLIVGFETYVLFRFFNGSPHLVDRLFTGLVCALISAAFLLWLEFGRGTSLGWREDVKRLAFQLGLWGTVFHVYGYPRSGNRAASVLHVFPGSLVEPTESLGVHGGILGQSLFLLMIVLCVNALLQRALRLTRHS